MLDSSLRPVGQARKSIAVIGAGIAGLACARICVDKGYTVTVFDKGRGPGGRLSSRRLEAPQSSDPMVFDHGAQYLTIRDEGFDQLLKPLVQNKQIRPFQGEVIRLSADGASRPVVGEESHRGGERWYGSPSMSMVPKALANGLDLRLRTKITEIRAISDRGWVLDGEETLFGPYDMVAVTVPAPQAAALLEQPAPALAKTARTAEMAPCWAVMLGLAEPCGIGFDSAFLSATDGPLAWISRSDSRPGRFSDPAVAGGCWTLHASPDWSQRHLEEPAQWVIEQLVEAFRDISGLETLPTIMRVQAHRWRYAKVIKPAQGLSPRQPCLWDADLGVGIAGDWTSGERVEDAWKAGQALGQAMTAVELQETA